jgi:hypothetical protein
VTADKVFLHVGAPKSGSSYLQTVLWANREALLDDGYLLPGNRRAHYELMADVRRGIWHSPAASWTWDRLVRRVHETDDTVLVSEEMLGAASREQAEDAVSRLGDVEVHVVVTVRDLWRSIPSAWQQAVRARTVGTFESFVARIQDGGNPGFWDNQFAVPILERWGALVPPERRHVVTVPRPSSPRPLLWSRFSEVLGIDAENYSLVAASANPSLGAPEAELLRRVNAALGEEFPLRHEYVRVVRRHLTQPVLMTNPSPQPFGAPVHLASWVEQRSKEMVEELASYPCRIVGDLDDLLPAGVQDSRSPDDYDDSELLSLAVSTMVGMLRHTSSELNQPSNQPSRPEVPTATPPVATRLRRVLGRAWRRLRRTGGGR